MEAKLPISSPVLPVGAMLESRSSSSTASSTTLSQHSSRHASPSPASAALLLPESSSIAESLRELHMSEREPKQMFSTLEAIFRQAEQEEGVALVTELPSVYEKADENYRAGDRDVEALRLVKGTLDQMWESHSKYLTNAAKVLADASRDRMLRQSL